MAKKLFVLTLVLCMLASFVGCSNAPTAQPQADASSAEAAEAAPSEDATKEPLTFGICMFDMANTFTSYIRKGIESYVADKNITTEVLDAAGDMTKQIEQCQTFIKKGVNGLIVFAVDTGGIATIVEMAKEAGIPVVFVDKKPEEADLLSYEKCYYVGLEASQSGAMQSELVLASYADHPEWDLNGDGALQYVLLRGDMGDVDAELRTAAIRDGFAAANVAVEELDEQVAFWDTTKAKEIMDTWVVKYGSSIEMVACNNDAMALGVVESLRAAGYLTDDKYVPIFGVNAIPDILDLIEDGTVAGTVLSDPYSEAKATIDIIVNMAQGRDPFEGNDWTVAEEHCILIVNLPISATENLDLARETYKNCL